MNAGRDELHQLIEQLPDHEAAGEALAEGFAQH